jgi:carboxyl-terminal processing protease
MSPSARTAVIASASAIVALCIGMFLGGHAESLPGPLRDTFVDEDVAVRAQLIDDVQAHFYKPVKKSQLEQGSFKGIVETLHDPYSTYLTPKEAKALKQNLQGQFEGVGMTIDARDTKKGLVVKEVFDGSPAKQAGLKPGDVIVAVDGKSTLGVPADESTARIRGKAGTTVTLSVKSGGKGDPRTVKVERRQIDLPLVKSKLLTREGKKIADIRLLEFDNGASEQVREAVDKALKDGAKGILLDLRGNPGGVLQEGQKVASIFVEKGVIVSTKGRTEPEQKLYAEGEAIDPDIPMVVLVDGNTASAAEIVTGALRDYKRATVVGTKTFGKGVVQQLEDLPNGGLLKLTVSSYYLPKGDNLAGKGIDAQVKAVDKPKTPRDEALPVALRTLLAKAR